MDARVLASDSEWSQAIWLRLRADLAALAIATARRRYAVLCSRVQTPSHPALRQHLDYSILPAAALFQALMQHLGDRDAALELVHEAVLLHVTPHANALRLVSRLPGGYHLIRAGLKLMLKRSFPSEGWDVCCSIDDSCSLAYAFRSCFYQKTLESLGMPEIGPVFCASHDYVLGALSPALRPRHRGSLALGGERCDWTYRRTS